MTIDVTVTLTCDKCEASVDETFSGVLEAPDVDTVASDNGYEWIGASMGTLVCEDCAAKEASDG
jgi:hypothetical protein